MSKLIRLEIAFWLLTAFLMGLLVQDAFSSSQGSWLAGCLLLIPTLTLQKGIAWALNFSGLKRIVRLFLVGVSSLYLAYLAIAFVYWYFLGFNSNYFEKSIINPILLWVIMGFFTGLYFFFFRKKAESNTTPETISFYSNRKLVSLKAEEIVFIESLGEYTSVQLKNGQSLKNGVKISEWTNRLPKFQRVHRSFLINPDFAIYKGQEIELNGEFTIPISRSYKELTREYFLKES
ncbi:LytR/AlgR family response regulator transcription factor [Algoriphagus limi]|uniref:LytTR family transcriptional regulator n=1 Tax=Algoriphagus limi TaxID=2975273 RepID=A0ABT2G861_9BACT|nr:LytTR family DNA-binding domain-containing protein [Algoriphagus limi]MCS5490195.1 LytTR family transcriptional regulator [Algoriphagus limi]